MSNVPPYSARCGLCSAVIPQGHYDDPRPFYWVCKDCGRDVYETSVRRAVAADGYAALMPYMWSVWRQWEEDCQALALVSRGKAWKISTSRLEQLIEKGWVNSTGVRLTVTGKMKIAR